MWSIMFGLDLDFRPSRKDSLTLNPQMMRVQFDVGRRLVAV
jgi:hypothetical protein